MKVHSKEERGLAAECKGNKNSLKKKKKKVKMEEGWFASDFFFFSANILSPKCELQSVSSLLLQHSSRSLSKAMPRSERGREKAATFSSLQNGWGPGESSYEQRGRVVLPVLLRGGLGDSVSISPPFPSPHSCPLSHSDRTNGVQLCCQSIRNSTCPNRQAKATTVYE